MLIDRVKETLCDIKNKSKRNTDNSDQNKYLASIGGEPAIVVQQVLCCDQIIESARPKTRRPPCCPQAEDVEDKFKTTLDEESDNEKVETTNSFEVLQAKLNTILELESESPSSSEAKDNEEDIKVTPQVVHKEVEILQKSEAIQVNPEMISTGTQIVNKQQSTSDTQTVKHLKKLCMETNCVVKILPKLPNLSQSNNLNIQRLPSINIKEKLGVQHILKFYIDTHGRTHYLPQTKAKNIRFLEAYHASIQPSTNFRSRYEREMKDACRKAGSSDVTLKGRLQNPSHSNSLTRICRVSVSDGELVKRRKEQLKVFAQPEVVREARQSLSKELILKSFHIYDNPNIHDPVDARVPIEVSNMDTFVYKTYINPAGFPITPSLSNYRTINITPETLQKISQYKPVTKEQTGSPDSRRLVTGSEKKYSGAPDNTRVLATRSPKSKQSAASAVKASNHYLNKEFQKRHSAPESIVSVPSVKGKDKPPVSVFPVLSLKEKYQPTVNVVPVPSAKEKDQPPVSVVPVPSIKEKDQPPASVVPLPSTKEKDQPPVSAVPVLTIKENGKPPVDVYKIGLYSTKSTQVEPLVHQKLLQETKESAPVFLKNASSSYERISLTVSYSTDTTNSDSQIIDPEQNIISEYIQKHEQELQSFEPTQESKATPLTSVHRSSQSTFHFLKKKFEQEGYKEENVHEVDSDRSISTGSAIPEFIVGLTQSSSQDIKKILPHIRRNVVADALSSKQSAEFGHNELHEKDVTKMKSHESNEWNMKRSVSKKSKRDYTVLSVQVHGDCIPNNSVSNSHLKLGKNGRYKDEENLFCDNYHSKLNSSMRRKALKNTSRYNYVNKYTLDSSSCDAVSVEPSLSEGEIKCYSSASIGEVHNKSHLDHFETRQKTLHKNLGYEANVIRERRTYFNHCVTYYINKNKNTCLLNEDS